MVLFSVDHLTEVTRIANMGLIYDDTNLISQRKTQLSTLLGEDLFMRPFDMT